MLKSMTAYGRSSLQADFGHIVIEIQSLNRKFLDLNVVLPKAFIRFENEIKKLLTHFISRGQVSVKVFVSFNETIPVVVKPNIALAKQIDAACRQLEKELQLSEPLSFHLLARSDHILTFEEDFTAEESYHAPLKTILETALQSFMKMKQQEGVLIQKDIEHRLALIQEKIKIIEEQALQAPQRYRERLIARLEDLLPGKVENEERIIREVAILAEKLDISEEIHRFSTHVNHFNELLNSDSKEVGKTLEFVLQELNREINTIGSKSSDLQIARGVIEVKSELEKIREQVQNVE